MTDETTTQPNDSPKENTTPPVNHHRQAFMNTKMSRQLLPYTNHRHGSSHRNQNELTLPPIVETQISSNNVNSNKHSTRVDSGIAIDYPSGGGENNNNNAGGWTLSPNESENGDNNNNRRYSESITTTIELVEGNNLKKNNTSSTLNSLGMQLSFLLIFILT